MAKSPQKPSIWSSTPWQGWGTVLARLILGGALLYAGLLKIGNLEQSVIAVKAYDLPLPNWIEQVVGYALPIFEIVVGALVVLGLFTRWTALLGGLSMVVYIIGLSQAWARGLQIDCGCFTEGGLLDPGESTTFGIDILRDVGLLICAAWAVWFPKSPFSVDSWVFSPLPSELIED